MIVTPTKGGNLLLYESQSSIRNWFAAPFRKIYESSFNPGLHYCAEVDDVL